jgi:hypothetical protein
MGFPSLPPSMVAMSRNKTSILPPEDIFASFCLRQVGGGSGQKARGEGLGSFWPLCLRDWNNQMTNKVVVLRRVLCLRRSEECLRRRGQHFQKQRRDENVFEDEDWEKRLREIEYERGLQRKEGWTTLRTAVRRGGEASGSRFFWRLGLGEWSGVDEGIDLRENWKVFWVLGFMRCDGFIHVSKRHHFWWYKMTFKCFVLFLFFKNFM